MSSIAFVAELKPDSQLRRWFFSSALLLCGVGIWTVSNLAISAELRWLGGAAWAFAVLARGGLMLAAQLRYPIIRIHADGSVLLQNADGDWCSATMSGNCVILADFAWLDLLLADNARYSVLVRGKSRESQQWRRLQVIWRHMGSGR